jgi:hypothetical protein
VEPDAPEDPATVVTVFEVSFTLPHDIITTAIMIDSVTATFFLIVAPFHVISSLQQWLI